MGGGEETEGPQEAAVAAAPPGAWPGLAHEDRVLETNEPSSERAGKMRALGSQHSLCCGSKMSERKHWVSGSEAGVAVCGGWGQLLSASAMLGAEAQRRGFVAGLR